MSDNNVTRSQFFKKGIRTLVKYFNGKSISYNPEDNPYRYDIDRYLTTDPDLLIYREYRQISLSLERPVAFTRTAHGELYVIGDRWVHIYDNRFRLKTTFETATPARCIATDDRGRIFLGMRSHITVYDDNGTLLGNWTSLGEQAFLISLAYKNNVLIVSDFGQKMVWHYDGHGKLMGQIKEFIIPSPYFDVHIDNDDALWVANTGTHSLEKYNHRREKQRSWGKAGMTLDGFAGCCNPSHFTVTGTGDFVTSEKGIPRVKLYDKSGGFKGFVAGAESFDRHTVGLCLAVDDRDNVLVLDPKRKMIRIFKPKFNE